MADTDSHTLTSCPRMESRRPCTNLVFGSAREPAGFHVEDKPENKLRALVCADQAGLRTVQKTIASNWVVSYGTTVNPRSAYHQRSSAGSGGTLESSIRCIVIDVPFRLASTCTESMSSCINGKPRPPSSFVLAPAHVP